MQRRFVARQKLFHANVRRLHAMNKVAIAPLVLAFFAVCTGCTVPTKPNVLLLVNSVENQTESNFFVMSCDEYLNDWNTVVVRFSNGLELSSSSKYPDVIFARAATTDSRFQRIPSTEIRNPVAFVGSIKCAMQRMDRIGKKNRSQSVPEKRCLNAFLRHVEEMTSKRNMPREMTSQKSATN